MSFQAFAGRTGRSDRRAYPLQLTAKGRNHLAELSRQAEAHDHLLDAIVGSYNKPLLIHLLQRIVNGLAEELQRPSVSQEGQTNRR